MIIQGNRKEYLGDGLYASYDGISIKLTTEDGISVTNTIYLDQSVWLALLKFVKVIEDEGLF